MKTKHRKIIRKPSKPVSVERAQTVRTRIAVSPDEQAEDRFENRILVDARVLLENKSLGPADIKHWSSWENSLRASATSDDVVIHLKSLGVFVIVAKSNDHRK